MPHMVVFHGDDGRIHKTNLKQANKLSGVHPGKNDTPNDVYKLFRKAIWKVSHPTDP